jgi:exodeoxyribonuclease VII large subunit
VPDVTEVMQLIKRNVQLINQQLRNKIDFYKSDLSRLLESPVITRPMDRINQSRQNLDNVFSKFSLNISNYYKLKDSYLSSVIGKLSAMDPKAILSRGYSMTLKLPEQQLVSSVGLLSEKDKLKILLKDGSIKVKVEEMAKAKNEIKR